jgi:hypothetical protein
MNAEAVILTIGGLLMYVLLGAFAGVLPIRSDRLRVIAMALWPITVLLVILSLPFLIWSAAKDRKPLTRYEAEKSLLVSLEKVVRGVERLQNEVRESERFLECLYRSENRDEVARRIRVRLERMRKDWPELLPRGKD